VGKRRERQRKKKRRLKNEMIFVVHNRMAL